MQYNSKSKVIKLPLYIILFIIFLIFICIFKFYSLAFSEDNTNSIKIDENSNIITIPENVITNNSQETIIENTTENDISTNTNINSNTSNKKTAKYTTKKGDTYETIGILEIPSLDIKYPILSETNDKLLKISLTKYWGGNPHEIGNLCILGHNYKNDEIFFGKLLDIKNGAIIKLTDVNQKTLSYKVYDTFIVDPDDTSCTSQLTDGHIDITLITCYYESGNSHATKRFVVKARAS